LPEANPAAEAAGKAREAAAKRIESYIDSLKREAATLGFNAEQIKRYEAAQLNLNATQRIAVDALIGKIEAYKEEEQRLKDLDEALKEHDEILKRSADLELETLQEVQQEQQAFANTISSYVDSVERAIDPSIELAENIGKLQAALSLGFN
jgi:chromosome segregation ATPase